MRGAMLNAFTVLQKGQTAADVCCKQDNAAATGSILAALEVTPRSPPSVTLTQRPVTAEPFGVPLLVFNDSAYPSLP
jgi:hypothetical protein